MKTRYEQSHPENGITIHVQVSPGSKMDGIAGRVQDRVKIKLKARAVEGAANEALVRYLSLLFGVSKSRVTILTGHASRLKSVAIEGEPALLSEKLNQALSAVQDS